MGRRKYRHLSPGQVAERAWSELTKPEKISEMKSNYVSAMDALPTNTEAKSRYVDSVSKWVDTMRSKEVRETIMKAIGKAKSIFLAKKLGTTPPPTA